jgi:hypothetical protein
VEFSTDTLIGFPLLNRLSTLPDSGGNEGQNIMGIQVKDASMIAAKWSTRAGAASQDYLAGVAAPRASQSASAIAAKGVWADSVASAAANDLYAKGLAKSGDGKWQQGVKDKGSVRYQPGVTAGKNNYQTGIGPVLSTLSSLNLPPRNVKGNNMGRVQMVVDALRKLKTQGA